jgi:hypothetical protein
MPARSARTRPGEGEHLHGEADVDRELEQESLPVVADVRRSIELAQDCLDTRVGLLVSADHDRQRSCLHLGNASRYRRVEHRRPSRLHPLRELAARTRADRAHVDPDLASGEAGEDPVGPGSDALEHVIVGEGREDDVGGLGDLARRVTPAQPLMHEIVSLPAVARFAEGGVSGGEEAGGHRPPSRALAVGVMVRALRL